MVRQVIQYILKLASGLVVAKYKPRVVAITGSVGKSSAKEAIFAVLESAYPGRVRRNEKNFNTEIGLPLTIIGGLEAQRSVRLWLLNFCKALRLLAWRRPYPEILVLEMGADKPGDIKYLTSIIEPDIAVVTAIGEMPVHLEFFPERDAYISEKANILKSLKPNGVAVLNYDDMAVRELRNLVPTGRTRVYYGFQEGAEVKLTKFDYELPRSAQDVKKSGVNFHVSYRDDQAEFKISKTLGKPPLYAALAAIAVGVQFNLALKQIAVGLEHYSPPPDRLEILKGVKNTIIINDSYNASPLSTQAALELLAEFKDKRKVAVLGSMRELGANTEKAHRQTGALAGKIADTVFLVGDEMIFAKDELVKLGRKENKDFFWFGTSSDAKLKIQETLKPGDVILIKGSRAVRMETIVEEIKFI